MHLGILFRVKIAPLHIQETTINYIVKDMEEQIVKLTLEWLVIQRIEVQHLVAVALLKMEQ
jgi:hypothetical protein